MYVYNKMNLGTSSHHIQSNLTALVTVHECLLDITACQGFVFAFTSLPSVAAYTYS